MKKRIYLSHPYGGKAENRERAAKIAEMYSDIWDAEGKTDWEIVNPLSYFEPLEGLDEEAILMMAVVLMRNCDGVLYAPGWRRSRGCRYEHFIAHHDHNCKAHYFSAEIPEELVA